MDKRPLLRAKLIYLHLNDYARTTLQAEPEFYVTLDKDDFDPAIQEITLNRAFLRDYGGDYSAFKIRAANSKDHLLLQAADLITGAVAWVWNGGLTDQPTSKAYTHRLTLAEIISRRTRIAGFKKKGQLAVPQGDVRTLGHYTVKQKEKAFRIWLMDLTKSKLRIFPQATLRPDLVGYRNSAPLPLSSRSLAETIVTWRRTPHLGYEADLRMAKDTIGRCGKINP